jgi:hypothetical protein
LGTLFVSVLVFVSFFVVEAVSLQPMNAKLTHKVSRIAVSFFIDASLNVR